jgi:hypothetical protein
MDFKELAQKIKNSQWKKLIYPAVSTVLLLLVVVFFLFGARFLSNALNKAFAVDQGIIESELTSVDFISLQLVAKKLGITIAPDPGAEPETPSPEEVPGETQPPAEEVPTEPVDPPPVEPPPVIVPEDKTAVKIQVLNSTGTAGLAGGLRTDLQQAGFTADVGNTSPAEATTIIKAKAVVSASFPNSFAEIQQVVAQKYSAIEQVLEDSSPYDIVIVIGNQ